MWATLDLSALSFCLLMSLPPEAGRPLEARHVALQFDRRQPWRDAAFLHNEIANRMLERLRYIRLEPTTVLDAGCGAGETVAGLAQRYPQARYIGHDHSAAALAAARDRHAAQGSSTWLRKILGREPTRSVPEFLQADLAATELPPESADLIWSNLALHWHAAPPSVFTEWFRILRPEGLVMFSCYGPATLQEVRLALNVSGLRTVVPQWVDMHDYGDMLMASGFADPVMDQETITLTYPDGATLLRDVRLLGGNPATERRRGLAGRAFRDRLIQALEQQRQPDGSLHLTIEVAYGHAWRGTMQRNGNETRVSVSAIGRTPRKPV